jgi:hypothetical protein
MPQYLLLLHEDPASVQDLSPEEMQQVLAKYMAWSQELRAAGRLTGGQKLRDEGGRHVRAGGRVTDGPYVEGKEVLGGFFVIEAADYDDAVAVTQACPHLAHGWVELREIDPT